MNMYAQTKVLPCQNCKFEKQDWGLTWLYWNSLKSTAGARRVKAFYMLVLLECLLALSTGPHEWGEFYSCLLSSSHPVIDVYVKALVRVDSVKIICSSGRRPQE